MLKLVAITSLADAQAEGRALNHAVGWLYPRLNEAGVLLYSVREGDTPVLTLSVRHDDQGVYFCAHVVGLDNRSPTDEELATVRDLLRAHRIALRYDPHSLS